MFPSKNARWMGAVGALATLVLVVPSAQERVKQEGPSDFKTLHAEVGAAFEAGHYSTCLAKVKELTGRVVDVFNAKVLASMPPAPEGYAKVMPKKTKQNAMEAAMRFSTLGAGNMIDQQYAPTGGGRKVSITVTSNSPLLQMFGMWIANPAMLGEGSELIKYRQCQAVLEEKSGNANLKIKLGDNLIEAKANGKSGDFLLKLMSQEHLDVLEAALAQ